MVNRETSDWGYLGSGGMVNSKSKYDISGPREEVPANTRGLFV